MTIQEQIKEYISSQPEPKRSDMQALHEVILQLTPACKLWFLDGKNSEGKIVSMYSKRQYDMGLRFRIEPKLYCLAKYQL